jgi:ribonuclease-3
MNGTASLEERIGYTFRDSSLLSEALTHPSALREGLPRSNQRLEFLGDAVLQLFVSERLFAQNPEADEGTLTAARASLVRGENLTAVARELAIGHALILGSEAARNGVQENAAVLEDALEALIGATYLDGGLSAARKIVDWLFAEKSFDATNVVSAEENPKGALQEKIHSQGENYSVEYEIVRTEGPPHERTFESVVKINGEIQGRGIGASKKSAEAEAARAALRQR